MDDLNHRMVKQGDFIENIPIQDQDVVNMREVNQETGVNRQSCQLEIKERTNVLLVHAAIVWRGLKMDNTSMNLVHEDTVVKLCDIYGVENTQRE